jgi:hypothetical protein
MVGPLHVILTAAVTALVVSACGLNGDRALATTQTTSAAAEAKIAPRQDSFACVEVASPTSTVRQLAGERDLHAWPQSPNEHETAGKRPSIEETPQSDVESVENPYSRSPLHEPRGTTYSDVGIPYPLPSIPVDTEPARATPTERSPRSPPFLGTSFGPRPASPTLFESASVPMPTSNGLQESSFGPDTAP